MDLKNEKKNGPKDSAERVAQRVIGVWDERRWRKRRV